LLTNFGFISVYDGAKKKNTKWWHALKEERVRLQVVVDASILA